MKIVISSGHGLKIRGASGYLDEVNEARKVVDKTAKILTSMGVSNLTFHDDISTSQNENLNRIVNYHNAQTRDLDVSVHFNAYQTTSKPMGTECLYVTQSALATSVASAMAKAGTFINRGPKKRTDLFFLNNTAKPSILIETCFVDSSADADLYRKKFDAICQSIAETISGQVYQPPDVVPPPEGGGGETDVPSSDKPVLGKGDEGPYVTELQGDLNKELAGCRLTVDGDFGSATEQAVIDYQRSRGLDDDGICGEQTWTALDTSMPVYVPPGMPAPLTRTQRDAIASIAIQSSIANYSWKDRGQAPAGYIKGFALSWANTYRQYLMGYAPAVEMAKANSGNQDKDVLAWYADEFDDLNMNNSEDGPDTLRHLWAFLLGMGMRESSGKHCCGRDMSADNVASDTAEAGLYQTSYNAHSSSHNFDVLFNSFAAGKHSDNPQGFVEFFKEEVSCSSSDWSNYGSGVGYEFQSMCKNQPAFACETCAIVLRSLRQHYGPVNRYEVELKSDADDMLRQVQKYIDSEPTG